ncbi:hypothetical protein RQP46_003877 [Phenoliferia psychrophenolica]
MPFAGNVAAASSASIDEPNSPLDDYHHNEFDPLLGRAYSAMATEPVFPLIQRVRSEVSTVIDTVLTFDQLKTPAINFSVVRPLSIKLSGSRPPAPLLYALLVNRMQFLAEADAELAFAGVNTTRGDVCELLAIKLLSAYGTAPASLELLHVLTHNFNSFEGVREDMFAEDDPADEVDVQELLGWGREQSENALALAIFTRAKRFVRSSLVQQVISAIYTGEISYRPEGGAHSLLNDDYKSKPVVEIYDWRKEPFLDHYRLRVPMIRTRLEFGTFSLILVLFLLTELTRSNGRVTLWETLFVLWSLGFCLDEFASVKENGIQAYFFSAYNVLDSMFGCIFVAFLVLRIQGIMTGDLERSELAFDTLSLAGCVLFPRLSISLLRGNIVLLALSAMVKEFVFFMGLASLCASGFLCSLYVLGLARSGDWGIGKISWLMFKIWLGNSFLGFEAAQNFHPVYGPLLIVFFAILSQTLLLTILISLLSNTFAQVQANAETEILHQKALRTIERVKTDAMTSYVPPLNLAAFAILFTLRPFLSPRMFHKLNAFMIKLFNLPILLFLALATRIQHRSGYGKAAARISLRTKQAFDSLPRGFGWDGASDGLGKLFERELTEAAIVVPALDDPREDDAESHARMGSLGSPLAKMFRVPEEPAAEAPTGDKASSSSTTASVSVGLEKSLVARLESIESALAILVGEIARNSDRGGEAPKPPLTSLSGAVEQSYSGTD